MIYQCTVVQNIAALHLGSEDSQVRAGLQGCRWLVRHQGPHLRRRTTRCRNCCAGRSNSSPTGSRASTPTSTPATIAARAGSGSSRTGPSRRSRSMISHRHRSLFDVPCTSAIEGQPDRQPGRRRLPHEDYCARARVEILPEQERDVPVSRRRPSHRVFGDGRAGRSGGSEDASTRSKFAAALGAAPRLSLCLAGRGLKFELLSHHAAINKLMSMMDYDGLLAPSRRHRAA